ncbi:hypothetical protein KKE34_05570 [Patescibacteria group bacterium]|nr:hypothetical protein [Patescibacteria group bacterium]MBU1886040.1 hypothetical protein [Patescibacteria group bacterium]
MKKILRVVGILIIFVGVVLGILQIIDSFSDKVAYGNITNIFERRTGTEYSNVKTGGVYPCELEITYKDKNGQGQVGKTLYETAPCSSFFNSYYKIGDKVNIVYSENNLSNVKINGLFDRFGFLIIFPLLGSGLIYFSKRLH